MHFFGILSDATSSVTAIFFFHRVYGGELSLYVSVTAGECFGRSVT